MAQRDLDSIRTVIDQVPLQRQAQTVAAPDTGFSQLIQGAAEVGQQVIKKSVDAKIVQDLSQAQLDIMKLKNDISIQYEGDPSAGFEVFQKDSKKILDGYKSATPAFFQGQFREKSTPLAQRASLSMQGWQIKQSRKNTINAVNQTIKNDLNVAQMAGANYAQSEDGAIDGLLQFGLQRERIEVFAAENLGSETSNELLRTYDEDYAKMFAVGVLNENPARAMELFKTEEFQQSISDPSIKRELEKAAQSNLFQMVEKADRQRLASEITANYDVFQKRMAGDLTYMEVELQERDGKISPLVAEYLKKDLSIPESYQDDMAVEKGVRQAQVRSRIEQRLDAALTPEQREQQIARKIEEKTLANLITAEAKSRADIAMGKPPAVADAQKFEGVDRLNTRFAELIDGTGEKAALQSDTTLQDLLTWQDDVVQSLNSGEITRAQANSYFDKTRPIVNRILDKPSSFLGMGTSRRIGNSEFSDAYEAGLEYTKSVPQLNNAYARNKYFEVLTNTLRNSPPPEGATEAQIIARQEEIANLVQQQFVREMFPQVRSAKHLPNAIKTATGAVVNLPQGLTEQPQAKPLDTGAVPMQSKYFDRDGNVVLMEKIQRIADRQGLSVEQVLIRLRDEGLIR